MAPFQSQPSKLFARDIVRYSDAELDQYLEANGRCVEVEDPENLSEDFIQRLRVRAGTSDTAQSRPIDLDYLTTRLEQISANRQALPRPPSPASPTTTISDAEEIYRYDLEEQTAYYNTLLNEGGRPSHPVSLGRDVIEDPGEYREILSFWSPSGDWKVFELQMGEWRRFRRWQRNNREGDRFPKYVEGVKQGMAEHGFTRPFRLDEDPERQDKLTTWIEYLDYEYWWYDKDMRFVKHHQLRYDEAWKELVDSKVLRPFETEEFICNIDSAFQHASEEDQAKKAVESAKLAVMSAQKAATGPQRSSLSQREPRQALAAAQSKLDAAIKSLELIKRRDDLVYEFKKKTKNYRIAKGNAERRSILLRWMLEQIPLIELELKPAKVAENDSDRADGRSCDRADELSEEQSSKKQGRKRSRRDDTVDDKLPSKRPRYNGQDTDAIPTGRSMRGRKLASSRKPGLASVERRGVKNSNLSTLNSPMLQRKENFPEVLPGPEIPHRRSVRITEREEQLRAAEKQGHKRSHCDDAVDDELPSKRPRYNGQDADAISTGRSMRGRKLASDRKPGLTGVERRGVKNSNLSTLNSPMLQKKENFPEVLPGPEIPHRRSVRIAEREQQLRAAKKQGHKRSRRDDTVDDELPSKRPRYNGQDTDAIPTGRSMRGRKLASSRKPGLASVERRGVKNSNLSTLNSLLLQRKENFPEVPPGLEISLRRSVRITEREERLRAAVRVPSDTVRIPRQGTARLTQVPIPPSSTQPQERKWRSSATKATKKDRRKRGDRRDESKLQGISKRKGRPCP